MRQLKRARQQCDVGLTEIERVRATLATQRAATGDVCVAVHQFLSPSNQLLNLRRQVVAAVRDIAQRLQRLTEILTSLVPPAPAAAVRLVAAARAASSTDPDVDICLAAVAAILEECRALLNGLTSIGKAGISADWTTVETQVARLTSHSPTLPGYATYRDRITTEMGRLTDAANRLRVKVASADATTILEAAEDVLVTAAAQDKRFVAVVLQSAAMGTAIADQVVSQVATAVKAVANQLIAPHRAVLTS